MGGKRQINYKFISLNNPSVENCVVHMWKITGTPKFKLLQPSLYIISYTLTPSGKRVKKRLEVTLRYTLPKRAIKRLKVTLRYTLPKRTLKRLKVTLRYTLPKRALKRLKVTLRYTLPKRV